MSDILISHDAGVCTISLNRVDKKNSINAAMYQSMANAITTAQEDEATIVLLIQGHETIFSAGNDIADFLQNPKAGAESPVMQFLRGIATFSKPLIAAVNGPAVGIGTTMLLHCDLVYAGDNAAFSMPFVNLGLCPEAASSLLLPQIMGYHRAAEALLLGAPITAQAALGMGFVNMIVPPAETNSYAQSIARKLAVKPLTSLMEIKRLMKKNQMASVLAMIADEGNCFARMLGEPAAREAFGAFMQKRKPDFSNI